MTSERAISSPLQQWFFLVCVQALSQTKPIVVKSKKLRGYSMKQNQNYNRWEHKQIVPHKTTAVM